VVGQRPEAAYQGRRRHGGTANVEDSEASHHNRRSIGIVVVAAVAVDGGGDAVAAAVSGPNGSRNGRSIVIRVAVALVEDAIEIATRQWEEGGWKG